MKECDRGFKGIWIPAEVWLDDRLTALDKVILAEVDSLDSSERGCWAANEHIAAFCQCSESKVSSSISKLIALGYVYRQSFDGRTRILKSCLSKSVRQIPNNYSSASQNPGESNIFNKPIINISREGEEKRAAEINTIVSMFNEICVSFPRCTILTEARKDAISARLESYSLGDFKTMFEMAEESSFLKGDNERGWVASFDWLMNETAFAKVLEGNFANSAKKQPQNRKKSAYEEGSKGMQSLAWDIIKDFCAEV